MRAPSSQLQKGFRDAIHKNYDYLCKGGVAERFPNHRKLIEFTFLKYIRSERPRSPWLLTSYDLVLPHLGQLK